MSRGYEWRTQGSSAIGPALLVLPMVKVVLFPDGTFAKRRTFPSLVLGVQNLYHELTDDGSAGTIGGDTDSRKSIPPVG